MVCSLPPAISNFHTTLLLLFSLGLGGGAVGCFLGIAGCISVTYCDDRVAMVIIIISNKHDDITLLIIITVNDKN